MTTDEAIAAIRAEVEAIIGEPVDPARWCEVVDMLPWEQDADPWAIAQAIRPDIKQPASAARHVSRPRAQSGESSPSWENAMRNIEDKRDA